MATVSRENIGLLHDKIKIKIEKTDYLPSFEKKLKEYSKTANIPGFRKGFVPAGMIKKMYGPSIFSDEVLRTVEKELYNYLDTEKPSIFAQPLPLETSLKTLDVHNPAEYEFDFEIGLKPAFEIADFSKAKLKRHKVEVTEQMVNEEINRMQIKGGELTDAEIVSDEENVLNILFTETDEKGNAVEGGITKENSVLVKYFTTDLQNQLMGKKTGDHLIFQLGQTFEGDKLEMILHDLGFAKDDKAAAEKYFKLDIVKIGMIKKREMTEDFFNEIYPGKEIKTEDELRVKLKEEIQQYWDAQSRTQVHDQLYHYLNDETKMDFPETFLKRWIQTSGEQQKNAEDVDAEFPTFSNQLKWTLISDKIINDNKLVVSNEELRGHLKNEMLRQLGGMNLGEGTDWLDAYIDRMMKDEKQIDAAYRRLVTEKLFSWVESQTKPEEKSVTPDELVAMQHNHKH